MQEYMVIPPVYRDPNQRGEQRREKDTSLKGLYRDFITRPIALPVWLWNSIVVLIYLHLFVFLVWGFLVLVAAVLTFGFGI